MASNLTDMEKEAAHSWREWPIYIVMRIKHLQEIQKKLRVQGETESQMIRREELLRAVHDMDEEEFLTGEAPSSETPVPAEASGEGEEYVGEIEYEDDDEDEDDYIEIDYEDD